MRARDPGSRALSTGSSWLTVGELLETVRGCAAERSNTGARLVPATDAFAAVVELVAADLAGEIPVVVHADTPAADIDVLLAAAADEHQRRGLDRAVPLLVVRTSGSSGHPRAVVRTMASWSASLSAYTQLTGQAAGSVAWAPGSVASTLTLFALWHALATGVPAVATGRWRGVPDGAAAETTDVHAVPAVAADVLRARLDGGLPRLRRMIVAGAAVPAALRTAAQAAGVRLVEYYGAAELSFVAADGDGRGLRAFPGVQLRVRDGRIEVRSPYLALGYLAGTRGPLTVDAEGWAGVGDLGRLTPDGALLVTGRGDDAISVGGHLVLAADVESVLAQVPGVAEVVCVGEPHDRLGARLVAVVRPRPEAPEDLAQALRRRARAALAPPARPVRYVLVDDLPRTLAGKVSRLGVADLV